jgi:hypothetical protein
MTPRRLASLTLGVILLAGGVAAAQPYPPPGGRPAYGGGYQPPPPPQTGRYGLTIGGAIGPGSMAVNCDGCDEDAVGALSLSGHIGAMVTPRLGLMGDFWGTWHFTGDFTIEHAINTLAVQYWILPIVWIKGGLGLGVVRVNYDGFIEAESDLGFAFLAAAGVELVSAPRFSLDLQLRGGATGFDGGSVGSGALMIGINWY